LLAAVSGSKVMVMGLPSWSPPVDWGGAGWLWAQPRAGRDAWHATAQVARRRAKKMSLHCPLIWARAASPDFTGSHGFARFFGRCSSQGSVS
jgi:hypothetical protein